MVGGISAQTEDILTRVEMAEAEVQGILQIENIILGCTDPEANNFDAEATLTFPAACNYQMRSCAAILEQMPDSATGTYQIQDPAFNNGNPLDVWCDMDTDGGGYTAWPCEGCQDRTNAFESNGCADMGLQYIVPRTRDHFCSIYSRYPGFWNAMIGVVGRHDGHHGNNFTPWPMRSDHRDGNIIDHWVAVDGGEWWLRQDAFGEPNGDNSRGAWLGGGGRGCGANDNSFNDVTPGYSSGSNYLYSTNDKLGPGLWDDGEPCVGHGCNCRPDCTNP